MKTLCHPPLPILAVLLSLVGTAMAQDVNKDGIPVLIRPSTDVPVAKPIEEPPPKPQIDPNDPVAVERQRLSEWQKSLNLTAQSLAERQRAHCSARAGSGRKESSSGCQASSFGRPQISFVSPGGISGGCPGSFGAEVQPCSSDLYSAFRRCEEVGRDPKRPRSLGSTPLSWIRAMGESSTRRKDARRQP